MPRIHTLHQNGRPLHFDLDQLAAITCEERFKLDEDNLVFPVRLMLKSGKVLSLDFKTEIEARRCVEAIHRAWVGIGNPMDDSFQDILDLEAETAKHSEQRTENSEP